MTVMETEPAAGSSVPGLLWLDLTRRCQLACVHCYNDSGPRGTHGVMGRDDWLGVLNQTSGAGVTDVQFIGGEPTLHPDFAELLEHALQLGIRVEVFSNLVHVADRCWELFQRPGVSLATSYYSSRAGEHDAMTGRRSHARTRANIAKAVRLGIPLRAGIIGQDERQIQAARDDLTSLGVTRIGADRVREFGRGSGGLAPDTSNLCGRCGSGRATIGPDGQVSPCVFSTWLHVGSVLEEPLDGVLAGTAMAEANATIRQASEDDRQLKCYPVQPPCFPAYQPCTSKGDIPPGCRPDDVERWPGAPGTHCNPRR